MLAFFSFFSFFFCCFCSFVFLFFLRFFQLCFFCFLFVLFLLAYFLLFLFSGVPFFADCLAIVFFCLFFGAFYIVALFDSNQVCWFLELYSAVLAVINLTAQICQSCHHVISIYDNAPHTMLWFAGVAPASLILWSHCFSVWIWSTRVQDEMMHIRSTCLDPLRALAGVFCQTRFHFSSTLGTCWLRLGAPPEAAIAKYIEDSQFQTTSDNRL